MIVTIDTNILVNAFLNMKISYLEVVEFKYLKIALDEKKIVEDEYQKICGSSSIYRKWFRRLEQNQSIHLDNGDLAVEHQTKLNSFGCTGLINYTLVAVASNTDKVLVTENNLFGKNTYSSTGASILKYLKDDMKIQLYSASEFSWKIWLIMAEYKLEVAEKLFNLEYFDDCISRAYYGMFYAAKAALFSVNVDAKKITHKGIRNKFSEKFVKTGKVDKKYSRMLFETMKMRHTSDYDTQIPDPPTKARAKGIIADLKQFIRKIREVLDDT